MKKTLVILLALAMVFSLLAAFPLAVLADDEGEVTEGETEERKAASEDPWDEWDGKANIQWYLNTIEENPDADEFHLKSAEDLAGFSYLVNAFYLSYTTSETKNNVTTVTDHKSCYNGLWYDVATGEVLGFKLSGDDGQKEFDYKKLGLYNPRPDGKQVGDERFQYTNNVGKYFPEYSEDTSSDDTIDGSAYIKGNIFTEKTVYLDVNLKMNDTTNFNNWETENPANTNLNVWMPIGGGRDVAATFPHFEGSFKGQGHTISGLYFSAPEDMNVTGAGLFGHIARSGAAKVQDVIVEKSFFRCSSQVAGICGRTDNVLSVINCHVRNTVIYAYSNNAGGIVGSVHGGSLTLKQCSATDIQVQAGHTVGALVASANYYGLTAIDCLATGKIEASVDEGKTGGWDIGIVVGRVGDSTVTVTNLIAAVEVKQEVSGTRKDYSGTCGVIWGAVAKHGTTGEEFKSTAKASRCYYVDLFETNGEVKPFTGTTACEKSEIRGPRAKNNIEGFSFYDEETNPTGIWACGASGQYPYLVNAGFATEDVDPGSSGEGGAGHDHDNPVEAKAATCTEAGNVFYYDCSICGHPVDEYGEEIDPIIPATGHTYVHKDEKAATATADGMKEHYQCSSCGKYFDTNKTEVKKADLVIPKTGKSGCGGVIVGAPVVAIVVLGATMLMKKKENESK